MVHFVTMATSIHNTNSKCHMKYYLFYRNPESIKHYKSYFKNAIYKKQCFSKGNNLAVVRYSPFLTSCSQVPNREWVPVFLMQSVKTRMFNHSIRLFKFVFDRHRFTSVRLSSNSSACIANTLRVLIACYMFTPVRRVHYLSSSISPVKGRIGNHIRKGRGLILLVTGPAIINHLSTNYTEF